MTSRRPRPHHQDSGAALILAMGFVLMIGAISAGLASLATSSVNNRVALELVRNREYAADGKIEQAISYVRSHDGLTCGTVVGFIEDEEGKETTWLNGIAIRVDWRNVCGVEQTNLPTLDDTVVARRDVIFSACTKPKPDALYPNCQDADVLVRAHVNFHQTSSGTVIMTYVQSWTVNR